MSDYWKAWPRSEGISYPFQPGQRTHSWVGTKFMESYVWSFHKDIIWDFIGLTITISYSLSGNDMTRIELDLWKVNNGFLGFTSKVKQELIQPTFEMTGFQDSLIH